MASHLMQPPGRTAKGLERPSRLSRKPRRLGPRRLQPKNRRIRALPSLHILARRLAKLLGRLRHVQNVINHLKRQPQRMPELRKRRQLHSIRPTHHPAQPQRTRQQRRRLPLVNRPQFTETHLPRLPLQIQYLTANQMPRPSRHRQLPHQIRHPIAIPRRRLQQQPESKRLQRIPRKHRHRLSIHLVARRMPTPEIIVVHARQIIVNQ